MCVCVCVCYLKSKVKSHEPIDYDAYVEANMKSICSDACSRQMSLVPGADSAEIFVEHVAEQAGESAAATRSNLPTASSSSSSSSHLLVSDSLRTIFAPKFEIKFRHAPFGGNFSQLPLYEQMRQSSDERLQATNLCYEIDAAPSQQQLDSTSNNHVRRCSFVVVVFRCEFEMVALVHEHKTQQQQSQSQLEIDADHSSSNSNAAASKTDVSSSAASSPPSSVSRAAAVVNNNQFVEAFDFEKLLLLDADHAARNADNATRLNIFDLHLNMSLNVCRSTSRQNSISKQRQKEQQKTSFHSLST